MPNRRYREHVLSLYSGGGYFAPRSLSALY